MFSNDIATNNTKLTKMENFALVENMYWMFDVVNLSGKMANVVYRTYDF